MDYMKLDIQLFSDGKVVIDTELNTKNFENGLNKMQSTSQKAGSSIKNIVAGLGITKLIGVAMNQISSSLDGAISRFDTLNNFPKVMSNLGIGAEDAQKSIDKMSDKLSGLPTTLDQGAMAVQRFTSANGDVSKSTDLFLALNNAILAGGASSEIQASALEQLSQSYAKGKPDMMEWRTAMTAMPAQLKQVATAMGYVNADALGEALRDGSVSMDQFMDTIVQLNETGVDGFQNFEQQAKNSTGGIRTSIIVAKTQVIKGVTDLVEGLNKGLQDANLPSIGEIIANIGKKAKEVLDAVAKSLPTIINVLKTLMPVLIPIVSAIATFKTIVTIISIVKSLTSAIALLNATMLANPIVLIVALVAGLVVAFVTLWKKSEAFRNFWIGLWDGIKNVVSTAIEGIKNFFTGIIDFVKNNWQGLLLLLVNPFAGAFKLLYDNLDGFRNFVDNFVQNVIDFFKQIPTKVKEFIGDVITFFAELPERIGYLIGVVLGHIVKFGIDAYNWVVTEVPKIIEGIVNFFKELPGKIWDFLIDTYNKTTQWGKNMIDKAKETAKNFLNAVVDFIKQLPSKLWTLFTNVITKIVTWKSNMIQKGKEAGRGLLNAIVDTIKNLPSRMWDIGKNLVHGIWSGIGNAKQWLIDKISGFGKSVIKGFKDTLGIHSPSTVMRDQVGKYLAQGLGVGFENEIDNVYQKMQQAVDLETAKMSANVQVSGASRGVQQVLNASATLENTIPLQIDLDGEVIYDNQQKVSQRKSLQYGSVK